MFKDIILGIKANWIEDDDFKVKFVFGVVWLVSTIGWLPFLWSVPMPIVITFFGAAFFGFILTALIFVLGYGTLQVVYDVVRYLEHLRQKGEYYRLDRLEKEKQKPANGME